MASVTGIVQRDRAPRLRSDRWFVVLANPNCDERAEASIEAAGFTAYRPAWRKEVRHNRTKLWMTRVFRLFPRYVFVRLPAATPPFGKIRACDGVASFLGVQGKPTAIPRRLVELLEIAEVTGAYDEMRPAPTATPETFAKGDAVKVDPDHRWFGGQPARVSAVHGRREVTLMFEHLAGMREVRVASSMVRKAA